MWDIPPASTPEPLPEAFTSGDGRTVIAKRRETDLPGLARALAYGRAFIFGASDLVFGEAEIAAHFGPITPGASCATPADGRCWSHASASASRATT